MAKSREELIRTLKSNIKAFNSYRQETKHEYIDLSGADLTGTNLCRVDLENVNLKDSELNFAYLHSAILKNSNLSDLTVGRADMTEADLTGANMTGADLTNTILYGANLTGIKGNGIQLEGAKLRETNFTDADLSNGNLSNLDLSGVNFKNANLISTDFSGSNLSNALHLNQSKFDETTIWPEANSLPSDFTPTSGRKIQAQDDLEDDDLNADFGPGLSFDKQEFEFLDFPTPQKDRPRTPIDSSTTELSSPFDTDFHEETEFTDELPDFEQFTIDQFEETPPINKPASPDPLDFDQLEPGLVEPPDGLDSLSEDDLFTSDFNDSFEELSKQKTDSFGTIAEQDFPLKKELDSFKPHPDLITPQDKPLSQPPIQPPAPPVHKPAPPIPQQLTPQPPAGHSPTMPHPQQAQPPHARGHQPPPSRPVPSDQMKIVLDVLNGINKKLDFIEKEQRNQRQAIEDLKRSSKEKETFTHKIEDFTTSNKALFSRLESKIDIIAQTDPLNQMDSLLGELSDSIRGEQDNIADRIINLSTIVDSLVSLIEAEKVGGSESDFTNLTTNVHQMLKNLESNIRVDQDKVDQKLEDLSTIIEGLSLVLENVQNETNQLTSTKVDSLSNEMHTISTEVNNINDAVNNINNTVGTLIELNQDNTAESQIYEAFYDFEFRLQLELEKNQNKLTNIEELFNKTSEKINLLNERSAHLEKLGGLENLPKLLETFRNQLFTEIQQTEQRSNRLREVFDDMVIQLESMINMQLGSLQRSVETEISTIKDLLKTQKIDEMYKKLNDIIIKIDENRRESKIDDEVRSIFEHLLMQVNEYQTSNQDNSTKLNKKFEDFEVELQMTLKDMDRRISKINSMIRNVYKALDGITDLISEGSRTTAKPPSHSLERARKSLLSRTKDLDDDIDDDDT